ncbi:MAG TPA: AsnC family transcriptional regulator [Dehalococcoidia bacterium]|nr:AsnC family transcriptional regulator [Dehalococcoidia bacterium]
MKLSTRVRYGLRALLELALHYGEGSMLIKQVAANQGISIHYLEQLFMPLKAAGLIKSQRGAKGGVMLSRPPSQIMLSEAVTALGGLTALVECIDNGSICKRSGHCAMRDIWAEMNRSMFKIIEAKTLQDVVETQRKKTPSQPVMYNI